MISSRLVRPIAAVVGWPIAPLRGAAGGLARENAVRNPSRTAATAAALMIGLALVTFVSVLGTGLLGTARSDVREQISARTTSSPRPAAGTPSRPPSAAHLAADCRAAIVSSVREDRARVAGSAAEVSGVDPATIAERLPLQLERGLGGRARHASTPTARSSTDSFAEDHDLAIGSRVPIVSPSGDRADAHGDRHHDPPRLSPLLGARADLAARPSTAPSRAPRTVYAFVAGRAPWPPPPPRHRGVADRLPRHAPSTPSPEFATTQAELSTIILNLLYVLLGLCRWS